MEMVPRKNQEKKKKRAEKEAKKNAGKKDVAKLREEMAALENEKIENPGFLEERAAEIAPYMYKETPTLFKVIYTESENDHVEISNFILDNIEKMNNGDLSKDDGTEKIGRMLFEKLVKPKISEDEA